MFQNRSVNVHNFAMVPRAEIPRSAFRMPKTLKTTFDSGLLVPIFVEEVLPGDTWNTRMTAFCRLATPIFPFMDNLHLETFFFFVPNRLVWSNWKKMMGEQVNPGDSISFVVPVCVSPVNGFGVGTLADYFGLPTVGQVGAFTISANAMPFRAYNLIYNEWFRDENLVNSVSVPLGDGPDTFITTYGLLRRGKRHDYFTSCLPWPQKGNTAVSLPLGTTAPVIRNPASPVPRFERTGNPGTVSALIASPGANPTDVRIGLVGGAGNEFLNWSGTAGDTGLLTDLSTATAATINQIRQAFQIQRLLERDARGGTRYAEVVRAHFGVISPDARLQRPEYLGGGHSPISLNPIAQNSGTGQTGQTTPLGTLGAMGTAVAGGHGFTQSFTEHGFVIGIANVRADLTYQQGMRRLWNRRTRYDYFWPVFAHLGEQAVLSKEIYATGDPSAVSGDESVFGYQGRWDEYRFGVNEITGLMRSTSAGTIDAWHLAQRFVARPVLNQAFIEESPPLARVLAVASGGKELLMDAYFETRVVRAMPTYSVPGMMDHF